MEHPSSKLPSHLRKCLGRAYVSFQDGTFWAEISRCIFEEKAVEMKRETYNMEPKRKFPLDMRILRFHIYKIIPSFPHEKYGIGRNCQASSRICMPYFTRGFFFQWGLLGWEESRVVYLRCFPCLESHRCVFFRSWNLGSNPRWWS